MWEPFAPHSYILADVSYVVKRYQLTYTKCMETEAPFITLEEAARRVGYRTASNLRTAVRAGRLRALALGPRAYVTTQEWLDAYLATLRPGNYKRGLPKSQDAGGGEAGE